MRTADRGRIGLLTAICKGELPSGTARADGAFLAHQVEELDEGDQHDLLATLGLDATEVEGEAERLWLRHSAQREFTEARGEREERRRIPRLWTSETFDKVRFSPSLAASFAFFVSALILSALIGYGVAKHNRNSAEATSQTKPAQSLDGVAAFPENPSIQGKKIKTVAVKSPFEQRACEQKTAFNRSYYSASTKIVERTMDPTRSGQSGFLLSHAAANAFSAFGSLRGELVYAPRGLEAEYSLYQNRTSGGCASD